VVRFIVRVANEPARRFRLLWHIVAWSICITIGVIGVGYAAGGQRATSGKALQLVQNLEPGGLRTHGWILLFVSFILAATLHDYRRLTRWALVVALFYSLLTATLVFGSWLFYPVSWGAPFWYLFLSMLLASLIVLAPPLTESGRRYDGSDRA
jgi:hypothetical protein